MCNYFMVTLKPFDYEAKFMLSHFPPNWVIRYKATPTQPVAVVRDPKTRTVEMFRWGLIPSWAKDPALGSRMINARAETLTEKPSFRNAFASFWPMAFMSGKKFQGDHLNRIFSSL